ncbi:MAG TPA: carboxypeptidase-like regulatory domain-containing protein [Polyangia bacterium]|jgi:hypothetical protein
MPDGTSRARLIVLGLMALLVVGLVTLILWQGRGHPRVADAPPAPPADAAAAATPVVRPSASQPGAAVSVGRMAMVGRVVDAHGGPIAGAAVRITEPVGRETRSERNGGFTFDGLFPDRYLVQAFTEDGAAGPVYVKLQPGSPDVLLRVGPAARLRITVVTEGTLQPIPDATVELYHVTPLEGAVVRRGSTDKKGVLELRGVPLGSYIVAAAAPGRRGTAEHLEPPAGLVWDKQIALPAGAEVRGRVLNAAGAPVPGVQLSPAPARVGAGGTLTMRPLTFSFSVRTDAQGAFVIPALEAGSFRLIATHPQYQTGMSEALAVDGKTPTRCPDIRLESGGLVAGRVVTAKGEAAARATVRIGSYVGVRELGNKSTITDGEGRFRLEGLPLQQMEVVAMSNVAASEGVPVNLRQKPEHRDLTVTLSLEGTIAGIAVDADGRPVPDALVRCMSGANRREAVGVRPTIPEMTDRDGRFTCAGLAPGPHWINVMRPGGNNNVSPQRRSADVQAKTGDQDVRVTLPGDGGLRGRVRLRAGAAPRRFSVGLEPGKTPQVFETKDGQFAMTGLPAGSYQVTVTVEGQPPQTAAAQVAEGGVADLGVIVIGAPPAEPGAGPAPTPSQ